MRTFKNAKVVMLPTNQKAGLGSIYKRIKDDEIGSINEFDKIGNLYINKNPNVQKSNSNFEAQHLYIISDDEIKIFGSASEAARELFNDESKGKQIRQSVKRNSKVYQQIKFENYESDN